MPPVQRPQRTASKRSFRGHDEQGDNDDDEVPSTRNDKTKRPERPSKRLRRTSPPRSFLSTTRRRTKRRTVASKPQKEEPNVADSDGVVSRKASSKNKNNNKRLSCPYCDQTFAGKPGLDYHVSHSVCRKRKIKQEEEEDNDGDDDKDDSHDEPKRKYQRFRGKASDRTCPHCKRVFTSVLGYTYHKDNRVCLIKERSNRPFYALTPGERYVVSSLGVVVEVIEDSRGTPTAGVPEKQVARSYYNAKVKRDQHLAAITITAAVTSLTRRRRLGGLYQERLVKEKQRQSPTEQHQVFDIYFGADPRKMNQSHEKPVVAVDIGPDPLAPPESYPDRIVVCKVIPDKRKFFCMKSGDLNDLEERTMANRDVIATTNSRLYLRRSDLKEDYCESDELYVCVFCGVKYTSKPGCQYHVRSKVCQTSRQKAKEAAQGRLESIERRTRSLCLKQTAPTTRSPLTRRRVKNRSIYPQVLIGMGFKLLPHNKQPVTVSAFRPKGAPRSFNRSKHGVFHALVEEEFQEQEAWQQQQQDGADGKANVTKKIKITKKPPPADEEDLVSPDDTLRELLWALQLEQSKLLGPIYSGVFKALKFAKPKQRKKVKVKKASKPSKHQIKQKKKLKKMEKMKKTAKKASPPAVSPRPKPPALPQPTKPPAVTHPTKPPALPQPTKPPALSQPTKPPVPAPIVKPLPTQAQSKPSRTLSLPPTVIRAQPLPTSLLAKMPNQPLPQIVDVGVLMAEIDRGRYPSIKRWTGERKSKCSICKELETKGNKLLYCTICPGAFHWRCIRTRYTIKDPEPVDDLMCHACIGMILSRRTRAEKRLLEKQDSTEILSLEEEIQKAEMDEMKLATSVLEGREHECCAAVARQVNDLTELLRDAQLRLSNSLELAKINSVRRQMIASCETEALF